MQATYRDTYEYEAFSPKGEPTDLAHELRDGFPLTDAIDWFWRNFVSEDGTGFRDRLIMPIVGDYNKIAENGEAWRHVEKQIGNFSANLTDNLNVLLDQHWEGKSATHLHDLVESVWEPALMLAETTAQFVAVGFEKLKDGIVMVAKAAARAIDAIVRAIASLAKKATPWGAVVGVIEWIVSGFEDFPYWSDVNRIREAIAKIDTMYQQVRDIVDLFKKYLGAADGFIEAAKRIPEVNSSSDLFYIAKKITTGTRSINRANEEGRETRAKHKQERDEILRKGEESAREG